MWLLLWAGCGPSLDKGADSDEIPTDPSGSTNTPLLALETPAAASFLAAGPQVVEGIARALDAVDVNGHPADLSKGRFDATLPLDVGITTLQASAVTADGVSLTDSWSVLAGDYDEPVGKLADAVQVNVSAESISSLGSLLDSLFDPATLGSTLTALNPVIDTADARVDLSGLTFDDPVITLAPGNGVIDVSISIPAFVLGLDATIYGALPFGIDLTLEPDLRADELLITTTLDLEPDSEGGLDAVIGPLDVEIVGFNLDTGILELVDWLVIDDDDLAVFLEDALSGLGPLIEPALDAQLAAFDLALETELLGAAVSFTPWIDAVDIDPSGLAISVGAILEVQGDEPDVPGHLTFPPPPPPEADDVAVTVSDAFMNRALFELWAGGAIDLELPLGAEDAAILFIFGGQNEGLLSLTSALPPVWLGRDGQSHLQLGEMALTVDTPGGTYGERVELVIAIDAKAELAVSAESAGIVLSEASVQMRLAGDSANNPALIEALPTLQVAFGLGISVINEQLSFPLADLLGDIVLPEMVFARDPSGLGTTVALSVDDLLGLAGLVIEEGPVVPSDVVIPASVFVSDGDEEFEVDNSEGWICGSDEIEITGDNGVWYVEEDASLQLIGAGHTVYATNGAYVRLDDPGNTVYADPDAEIDDRDGSNSVTIIDPLRFDRSIAPTPGC